MELSKKRGSSDLEKQLGESMEKQDARQSASPSCFVSPKGPIGGWRAASFILGMEFFERLSILGIGLNLVTYLHDQMRLPLPRSANIVTNFMGTSFLTCLLGGFIADTYLGRYKTATIGCCVQLLGMILVTLSTVVRGFRPAPCNEELERTVGCEQASERQVAVLYIALYLIAFGTGGIKSSVSGLGADQFEEVQEEGRKQMQSFFNWFGVSVSAGATLAITVLVYVQDNKGRSVGYAASAACMFLSLLLFLSGSPFYRSKPPSGSAFTYIAHVLVAAFHNRSLRLPASPLLYHHTLPSSSKLVLHTQQFSCLDRAALVPQAMSKSGEMQSPWRLCSLEQVEEVKMVIRLLPILATTIVFWTVNGQALTFSIEQGATLDRRLGKTFQIPPASFPVVLQLSMLLTIPFYDRVLLPLARKWRGNEYGITTLQRIGIGLLFSTLGMVVAALVENKRLKLAHSIQYTTRLPMTIFYLTPQYALVGIGEAFAYVGQLHFFYRESPNGMRSLGTGLCLSTLSFGLFLSSALVSAINRCTKHGSSMGWLANNLDNGRLDYFYWFLALLSTLSFLCYLLCSHWYKYNHTWDMDMDMDMGDRKNPQCDDKLAPNVKIANPK